MKFKCTMKLAEFNFCKSGNCKNERKNVVINITILLHTFRYRSILLRIQLGVEGWKSSRIIYISLDGELNSTLDYIIPHKWSSMLHRGKLQHSDTLKIKLQVKSQFHSTKSPDFCVGLKKYPWLAKRHFN